MLRERIRQALSPLLAFALALSSAPAQAQIAIGRVSLQAAISPGPALPGSAPAAASLAPAALAPLPLQPALLGTPSISGAPSPFSALVPAAAAPSADDMPAPSTILKDSRESAEAQKAASGEAFDGAPKNPEAGSGAVPAGADLDDTVKPSVPRRTFLRRVRDSKRFAFSKGLFITGFAAAGAPIVWGATPAATIWFTLNLTNFFSLAITVPIVLSAAIRRKAKAASIEAAKPPPSRRGRRAASALGAVLALGFAVAVSHATGPVVQHLESRVDARRAPDQRGNMRWIRGGTVQDETIKELSLNPDGRELLNRLRDRGGVIRLPTYFISRQAASHATYQLRYDGVHLDEDEITSRGWTVEQFLNDPALQRRLIREMRALVFHELVHAEQARRTWTNVITSIEIEQEAFLRQTLFTVAELDGDPKALNDGSHPKMLEQVADDLDAYLVNVAKMYPDNKSSGDPRFQAFIAEQRARWPALRIRIYQLLAARAASPESAKILMAKAAAAGR